MSSENTVFNVRYLRSTLLIGSTGGFFRAASTKSMLQVGSKDLATPLVSFKPETQFCIILGALSTWSLTRALISLHSNILLARLKAGDL